MTSLSVDIKAKDAILPINSQRMEWSCVVCLKPCQPNDAMRRNCCERGVMHLACIENIQLVKCPGCERDPMKDLMTKSGSCTLKPLEQSVVPCAPLGAMKSIGFLCGQPEDEHLPPPSTVVDRANRYLDAWKSMISNQLREATDRWSEQIEVKRLSVGVTLLDGSHVWCLKRFKDTLTKARDVESRIVESIERSIALTNCR